MKFILLSVILIIVIFFLSTYICYCKVFAVFKKHKIEPEAILEGEQYEHIREESLKLISEVRKLEYEDVYIKTKDNLKLHARYYEVVKSAPVQILFHGYRSNALRDFCGGLQLALDSGFNCILVDQRAHGESEGKCLSFGIKERYDCLEWIEYAKSRFGNNVKIILSGVSMGAATVLMASDLDISKNVAGIISDSGYSSPSAIIKKVAKEEGYSIKTIYPLIRLAGKVYGGFDIEENSTVASLSKTSVPVLFIHGEGDLFVPCDMTHENYKACASKKCMLTVPGAGHGLSYLIDNEAYCNEVREFLKMI